MLSAKESAEVHFAILPSGIILLDFARPSKEVLILKAAESEGFDIGIEERKIGEKCAYPVMTCS